MTKQKKAPNLEAEAKQFSTQPTFGQIPKFILEIDEKEGVAVGALSLGRYRGYLAGARAHAVPNGSVVVKREVLEKLRERLCTLKVAVNDHGLDPGATRFVAGTIALLDAALGEKS